MLFVLAKSEDLGYNAPTNILGSMLFDHFLFILCPMGRSGVISFAKKMLGADPFIPTNIEYLRMHREFVAFPLFTLTAKPILIFSNSLEIIVFYILSNYRIGETNSLFA